MQWLSDSQHLVSVSLDKSVKLSKLPSPSSGSKSLQPIAKVAHADMLTSLAVEPDWIASAGSDKTIQLWDFSLKPLRTISFKTIQVGLAGHPNGNWAFS